MTGEIPTVTNNDFSAFQIFSTHDKTKDSDEDQKSQKTKDSYLPPGSGMTFPYYAAAAALPRIYPTAANPSIPIPAGRIVDDSSRGTLFWEVVDSAAEAGLASRKEKKYEGGSSASDEIYHDSQDLGKQETPDTIIDSTTTDTKSLAMFTDKPEEAGKGSPKSAIKESDSNWTVPFKIEWLSPPGKTVPFFQVRHMRNPYNKNRFLKIARDGTEIEPSVGMKLVAMFEE